MTTTAARLVALLFAAILLPAPGCGGASPEDRPASAPPDTAYEATPGADTAGVPPAAGPAAGDAPGPAAPVGPAPGEPAGDTAVEGPAPDPAASPPGWVAGPVHVDGARPVRLLAEARAAGHEGYDRFVLELAGGTPGYTVGWADGPLHQCGSGRPIDAGAPAALRIEMRPAAAHDDRGRPTVETRDLEPRLAALRTARLTCDYEATVEWVLGTVARSEIRVFTMETPARLVVDVRHP